MTNTEQWAGIMFDGALIESVQAAVLREGIVPSGMECAAALFSAYRGYHGSEDVVSVAAREVWENRAQVLAARDA